MNPFRVAAAALALAASAVVVPVTAGASTPVPVGVTAPGPLRFDDEFSGTAVDGAKWNATYCKTMNKVTVSKSNVTVANGVASLRLSSSSVGGMLTSASVDGCPAPTAPYGLPVGGYAEARVLFPKAADGHCANWPAWWVSGPSWPAAGEHDIAEVLEGQLTGNYHSPSGGPRTFSGGSSWCGGWHVYGLKRNATSASIYWDGVKKATYATSDNGKPEALILNIGVHSSYTDTSKALQVDYVRTWH